MSSINLFKSRYIIVKVIIEKKIADCEFITKGNKIVGDNQKIESTNVVEQLATFGLIKNLFNFL